MAKIASIFLMAAYPLVAVASIAAFGGCSPTVAEPSTTPEPSASDVTLSDGTFNPADWSVDAQSQTTSGGTAPSGHVVQQETSGGNTGNYRHMFHTIVGPSPPASVSIQHYFHQTYDPSSQGAITSIDYSEDRIELNPPFSGAAIGSAILLKQGGRVFVKLLEANGAFTNTTWATASLNGLTKADFSTGGLVPDFSSSGTAITFGYLRSNSNSAQTPPTTTTNTEHGIDNWKITIHKS